MDCIVTGGAGFIGSNLVDALIARGDRVAVIDNLQTGKLENLAAATAAGAQLHRLDVRDAVALDAVFASVRPQVVFHLAAQIDVRSSVEDPAADAQVNVLGALNVLSAALAYGARRVVNTSTGGGLYGDAALLPTPEEHPVRPLAPYGQSKYAAEGYFELYTRLHGLSTVSLRYGNVYGPRQDVHGEAGVVAIFCGCLIDAVTPRIFGDGRQTRDWVEVADVVQANLQAADSDVTGPLNIGWGEETSVLELVRELGRVGAEHGLSLPAPEFLPARAGEVSRSCLDVRRARAELGWEPRTRLGGGLEQILAGLL
ncbi:NAD-dependent epimerase/dehydratase family protein [Conexibacter sp. S30A1]|uniref:NAD-dependent epimerase/dehydratase family protein n=1 Tax=Conexibacter sp. S30A1 TaxID=2937800 RepID=UPI00200CAFE1|nr:GDP-mannose 4,6-dehydratase [Conexibacter sp. S30A1]